MSKTTETVTLRLMGIIRRETKHRSFGDRRRRVNYILATYRGSDGHEYRKSFESYDEPMVPESGDNSAITKLAIQY